VVHVQHNVRVDCGKPANELREDGCCERLVALNPHLSLRGIRQEFNVPHALLKLVKSGHAAPEQRGSITCWFDALSTPIKQPHAECAFQVSNHFRYGRLRDSELFGCLGHAAALRNREERMQVAHPQATANLDLPAGSL